MPARAGAPAGATPFRGGRGAFLGTAEGSSKQEVRLLCLHVMLPCLCQQRAQRGVTTSSVFLYNKGTHVVSMYSGQVRCCHRQSLDLNMPALCVPKSITTSPQNILT
eukprot:390467-Pelagomonas_calceolata.AAC.1